MKKPNWPRDFHNELYGQLSRWRANGLTRSWWGQIVPLLSGWSALRPRSQDYIRSRGIEFLPRLDAAYQTLKAQNPAPSTDLTGLQWEQASELYDIAYSIKDVSSPVFGSKLCHFILPSVYPVIDRDVVGLAHNDYYSYWMFCREEWAACPVKNDLISRLRDTLRTAPVSDYPWGSKITELCLIGQRA